MWLCVLLYAIVNMSLQMSIRVLHFLCTVRTESLLGSHIAEI